MTCKNRPRNDL